MMSNSCTTVKFHIKETGFSIIAWQFLNDIWNFEKDYWYGWLKSAIFEAFTVNSISVYGMITQNVIFPIFSYLSFDKIRLNCLKSGFFYAGFYCTLTPRESQTL